MMSAMPRVTLSAMGRAPSSAMPRVTSSVTPRVTSSAMGGATSMMLTTFVTSDRRRWILGGVGGALVVVLAVLIGRGPRIGHHTGAQSRLDVTAKAPIATAHPTNVVSAPASPSPAAAPAKPALALAPAAPHAKPTLAPSAPRAKPALALASDDARAVPSAEASRHAARTAHRRHEHEHLRRPARHEEGGDRHASHPRHTRSLAMSRDATAPATADGPAGRAAYQRGNGLLLGGDAAGAVAAYEECVRAAPTEPEGYRGLGLAYEKQGNIDAAMHAFRRYLKLAPRSRDRELVARRLQRLVHPDADEAR